MDRQIDNSPEMKHNLHWQKIHSEISTIDMEIFDNLNDDQIYWVGK